MLSATSGTVWFRYCTSVKVAASRWVLALALLIAHTKRVLLTLHEERRKPLTCTGSGALLILPLPPRVDRSGGGSSAWEEESFLPL